jgi:hypothetical protein
MTPWAVAEIVKAREGAAGFELRVFGDHSLKRGALTTGMDRGEHPARLKGLGWNETFNVLGEYMELGDPFGGSFAEWCVVGATGLTKQMYPDEPLACPLSAFSRGRPGDGGVRPPLG